MRLANPTARRSETESPDEGWGFQFLAAFFEVRFFTVAFAGFGGRAS